MKYYSPSFQKQGNLESLSLTIEAIKPLTRMIGVKSRCFELSKTRFLVNSKFINQDIIRQTLSFPFPNAATEAQRVNIQSHIK